MKNTLLVAGFLIMMAACKKETSDDSIVKLKSITYTHATNPLANKSYTIYRNAADLIDSIVINGSDATAYKSYVFYHTAGRLDSVMQYTSSGLFYTSRATWSGNNLVAFWVLNYEYNSQQRITKKLYTNGSFFRVEHFADSSAFYYDETGPLPEYKSYVQYYNKTVKNPFRMYKYESAYAISNFIFNAISSDFSGTYTYPSSDYNQYNAAGNKTGMGTNTYSGNYKGYPTSLQQINNDVLQYTLTFVYE
jgi:hypothetical protein